MGEKINRAFEIVLQEAGLGDRMRVSMQSAIPSALALEVPDSPVNLEKIKNAVKDVLKNNQDVVNKILTILN
ncbi:MAG: hypothetical protein HQM16_18275 [Deltaproteobacteria bacterium]|nr:hypothetical protein [Deltaproteobacteria bacterium]